MGVEFSLEAPFTVETQRAPKLVLEEPDCLEVWDMTQGQILQQGRAAQGAFPGDKPISSFSTLPMPSWALASFFLAVLARRLQLSWLPSC